MTQPACFDIEDFLEPGDVLDRMMDVGDHRGRHPVEHADENGLGGLPDDAQDGDGNEKTDDRIGKWKTEPDARGTENDGQAGEAVRAGVISVGNQRRAVYLTADADAEYSDDLVAYEADDAGNG